MGFYGHPDMGKIKYSWELLESLKLKDVSAWCVSGDFREILLLLEKVGGRRRDERQMSQFQEVLEDNNLFDLDCTGNIFTWSNKHTDHTFTKERLDRFVANKAWISLFKEVGVEGLSARSSDHKPILLSKVEANCRYGKRQHPFKFETSWIRDEGCEQVVMEGRLEKNPLTDPMVRVQHLLQSCSGALQGWSRSKDRDRVKEIEVLTIRIKEVQDDEGPYNVRNSKSCRKRLGCCWNKRILNGSRG